MTHFDIKEVARAALDRIDTVLANWVPDGRINGAEYVCLNPTRADNSKGSFSINRSTGVWSDFAEGKGGSDLVALVAYLERSNQGEACKRLAKFLGLSGTTNNQPPNQTHKPKKTTWQVIMPVPVDAVNRCPIKHYKNGTPSALWSYFDPQGALLMKVMRFDIGKDGQRSKDYRPLTYCKAQKDGNKQEWRWQQPPNNRPLYGLDRLAARPDMPVLLTEGEKAADAAIELLPDFVCMTWSGGSKALTKTDFTPLKGRKVALWPDNDEAGQSCMQQLAASLTGLGVAVSIVNLAILGKEWPQKADAADAIANGVDAEQLAVFEQSGTLMLPYKPTLPTSPGKYAGEFTSRFVVNDKGVFYRADDNEGDSRLIRICDRLDVVALTRDKQGRNWGTLVRFTDPDGITKEWNIASEYLATEGGAEVLRQLFGMGLRAESGQQPRRRLIQYLQTVTKTERYILVNKLGWHGKAYLLPDCTIGTPKEPLYFYANSPDLNKIGVQGELSMWRENIAAYCINNPRLLFAVSAAFAAPLLHLIGMETTGFHFFGDSSQGKTTLLRVAASVYGSPDYVRTWRSTDNALESVAAAHSDGLLILDEISQCDPRIVGDIAYLLGNGKGKTRANDRGGVRSNALEWRLLFLSTGEKTLAQQMAEVGKKTKAGQDIRLLAIPSDAGNQKGIFNDLHSFAGGAALSSFLVEKAASNHGEPLYSFIESLCSSNLDKLAIRIRSAITTFSSGLSNNASGQVRRAAEKFALVGFAGELASIGGITGWPKGAAADAAKTCFDSWVSARGGLGNLEDQQILSHIKLFFELYGEARFTRWDRDDSTVDEHSVRTMQRCGFRRTMEDNNPLGEGACEGINGAACSEVVFYVTQEAFKSELCNGFNLKRTKELLADCGALERDTEGRYSLPVRLPGGGRGKQRVYVIRPHLIPSSRDSQTNKEEAA